MNLQLEESQAGQSTNITDDAEQTAVKNYKVDKANPLKTTTNATVNLTASTIPIQTETLNNLESSFDDKQNPQKILPNIAGYDSDDNEGNNGWI
jgi:chaperonin GroEL (HSP60 family)